MKQPNFVAALRFFKGHRYQLLMVALLFLYSCELNDEEVLNSRVAFVGSFSVNQTCRGAGNSTDKYTLRISQGAGSNGILLTNLRPFADEIVATVAGNTLTIRSQSARLSGQTRQVTISGSGTLTDGSVIEIDFDYDFGGNYSCGANGFKL